MKTNFKSAIGKVLILLLGLAGLTTLLLLILSHPRSSKPLGPGPMHKGQTTESWVDQIGFANPQTNPAINEVAAIGAPAVPYILARLNDRSPAYTRGKTYWYLWQYAPVRIRDRMKRPAPPPEVEEQTIAGLEYTLGLIGPQAKSAVPSLIRVLQDQNMRFLPRVLALQALGQIGPDAGAAIPCIIDCLKDDHLNMRRQYLARNGPGYDAAADGADRALRTQAAMALIRIGTHDTRALPQISLLLADTNFFNRSTAIVALWALDPKPTNFELVKSAIQSSDSNMQRWTAGTLGVLSNRAAPFKPLLEELLANTNPTNQLHQAITNTLNKIQTPDNSTH
jgi:HEAT repeat protein